MNSRRVVDDVVLEAGRETLRQLVHRRLDVLRRRQSIRAGPLENAEPDRRVAVEIGVASNSRARQARPRDILEPHDGVRRLLDDDVAEFLGLGEPAERLHGDLEGAGLVDRRLIEHARRDLHVLALQRADDVIGGQAERLQPVRIEPDAHRIVAAAEHGDRPDAFDARQHVDDLDVA